MNNWDNLSPEEQQVLTKLLAEHEDRKKWEMEMLKKYAPSLQK